MTERTPKAQSVTKEGESDGFEVPTCWYPERDSAGTTRLIISAPPDHLERAHRLLLSATTEPLQMLYRQVVDRRDPKPQGGPSRDFVGLGLSKKELLDAMASAGDLLYADARGEFWVRDAAGSQIVLDADGLLFAYPDDVAFRDALQQAEIELERKPTVAERDYVRHSFLSSADTQEDTLIQELHLSEVAPQSRTGSRY